MFKKIRDSHIPNLKCAYELYEHPSGAIHIHLRSESAENAFLVAFPTIPESDDGRAHILEHLALCGSGKFPTRDPFFAMTRRSLATFMNAFTYPDRTVYPFASTDKTDFFNLLSIYLDAAFFPKLDYLDFRQEGWRHEIDADGKLSYQGVVFNEMKGALNGRDSFQWRAVERALKPGTTYTTLSGGDPLAIPSLTHAELLEFHASHYHPSQATFMSFGNIEPEAIQSRIESEVISKISARHPRMLPQASTLAEALTRQDIPLPVTADAGRPETEFGFAVSWLLGAAQSDVVDDYQVFSRLALGPGNPLSERIQNAGFGRPGLIHLDNSAFEASLHLGMDGLAEGEVALARELIFNELTRLSAEGIPAAIIESALRDFELEAKEINGSGIPHGLSLMLHALNAAMHGRDPLRELDTEPWLAQSRARFADPEHVKGLAQALLEALPRVETRFTPQESFFERRAEIERSSLAASEALMDPGMKQQVASESEQLKERQNKAHDFSCLPIILPKDVSRAPQNAHPIDFQASAQGPSQAHADIGANGVSYLSLSFDAAGIAQEHWPWVNLMAQLLLAMPERGMDWAQAARARKALATGISTSFSALSVMGERGSCHLRFGISAKNLDRFAPQSAQAISRALMDTRFDDPERIAYLIQSSLAEQTQGISDAGPAMASSLVSRPLSAAAHFNCLDSGIEGLRFMQSLEAMTHSAEGLERITQNLEAARVLLLGCPSLCFSAGSDAAARSAQALRQSLSQLKGMRSLRLAPHALPGFSLGKAARALSGASAVNFCHMALAMPQVNDLDSARLDLYARLLTHDRLHRSLREQGGAYGGGAKVNAMSGIFHLSSYRDPNLSKTFQEFEAALEWGKSHAFSEEALNQAKISMVQGWDKPQSPRGLAQSGLEYASLGFDDALRARRREAALDADLASVQDAAHRLLDLSRAGRAAFIGIEQEAQAREMGVEVERALIQE